MNGVNILCLACKQPKIDACPPVVSMPIDPSTHRQQKTIAAHP